MTHEHCLSMARHCTSSVSEDTHSIVNRNKATQVCCFCSLLLSTFERTMVVPRGRSFDAIFSRWRQAAMEMMRRGETGEWHFVVTMSSEVIDDIQRTKNENPELQVNAGESAQSLAQHEVLLAQTSALLLRGNARAEVGNLQGAVNDFSESIAISELFGSTEQRVSARNPALLGRCNALYKLSVATKDPSQLATVIEDYRLMQETENAEVNSVLAIHGSSYKETLASALLKCIVTKRVLESPGRVRPLFTLEEQREIKRELKIGPFAKDAYKCNECGSVNDDLHLCGGCRTVWFCDRQCQLRSWKTRDHTGGAHNKKSCAMYKHAHAVVLSDAMKEAVDSTFRNEDVSTSFQKGVALVHDPSTGRYFDGLSDNEVYFIPSESELSGIPPILLNQILRTWSTSGA